MRARATDVAWSVCLSVSLRYTTVNPAKPAEPIKMPFVLDHVLDGDLDPLGQGKGHFGEGLFSS